MTNSLDIDSMPATLAESIQSMRAVENELRDGLGSQRVSGKALHLLCKAQRVCATAKALNDLLTASRLAAHVARDSDVEFHGINDYHTGAVSEAIEILLSNVATEIELFAREVPPA